MKNVLLAQKKMQSRDGVPGIRKQNIFSHAQSGIMVNLPSLVDDRLSMQPTPFMSHPYVVLHPMYLLCNSYSLLSYLVYPPPASFIFFLILLPPH